MLGFLKKLFGFDEKVYKDAGVQIEQAPYKLEVESRKENDDMYDAPGWLTDGDPKTMGEPVKEVLNPQIQVVEEVKVAVKEKKPVSKPSAMKAAPKKSSATKKPAAPKPTTAPKRGRKPKAKS